MYDTVHCRCACGQPPIVTLATSRMPSKLPRHTGHHQAKSLHRATEEACWNVRTMLRAGKLENIKQEMNGLKINILGISETMWPEDNDFCRMWQ